MAEQKPNLDLDEILSPVDGSVKIPRIEKIPFKSDGCCIYVPTHIGSFSDAVITEILFGIVQNMKTYIHEYRSARGLPEFGAGRREGSPEEDPDG